MQQNFRVHAAVSVMCKLCDLVDCAVIMNIINSQH